MKKFMFLHFGFEQPTPEIMEAWEKMVRVDRRQADRPGRFQRWARNLKFPSSVVLSQIADGLRRLAPGAAWK